MRRVYRLNFFLFCLGCVLLVLAVGTYLSTPAIIGDESGPVRIEGRPPPDPFMTQLPLQFGPSSLTLHFAPPSLQLPDLRQHLLYYGMSRRPDAQLLPNPTVQIAFKGGAISKNMRIVEPNKPLYLVYTRRGKLGRYTLSENNAETGIWIELSPDDKGVEVAVFMRDQNGDLLTSPPDHRLFRLDVKDLPRFSGLRFEIDGLKADSSLLSRQKARWYGKDLFLVEHGGAELAEDSDKERIGFGESPNMYAVLVEEGGLLAYRAGRWEGVEAGENSFGFPLLHLQKVEDNSLSFELWDPEGKVKVPLKLNRGRHSDRFRDLVKELRFKGVRTRSLANLEISGRRLAVRPEDWLLRDEEGRWQFIDTLEKLDNYLDGTLVGTLLVIEGIKKGAGGQMLMGHVFGVSRSVRREIEMTTQAPFVVLREGEVVIERGELEEDQRSPFDLDDDDDFFEAPEELDPEEIQQRWEEFKAIQRQLEEGQK